METNNIKAKLYDPDSCTWHDISIVITITPGVFRINYPYNDEHRDIVPLKQESFFRGVRNWFNFIFNKPILCSPEDFTVDPDTAILKIDVGFPMEEPMLIRVEPNEIECVEIKKLWLAKES